MPDLDKCQWEEDGQRSTYSIASLRVFYQDKIRLAKETVGEQGFEKCCNDSNFGACWSFVKKDLYLVNTQKLINLQVLADCPSSVTEG